jgi:hypothetical protein
LRRCMTRCWQRCGPAEVLHVGTLHRFPAVRATHVCIVHWRQQSSPHCWIYSPGVPVLDMSALLDRCSKLSVFNSGSMSQGAVPLQ